jgi:hypothetical protein
MTAQAPQTNRKADRIFFPVMLVLILITVWIGFARTYYAVGMVKAPLPDAMIHIHAVVFTGWLVLLIVQTGLVSAKRTDIHKKLGMFAMGWACLMVAVALPAATDMLRRGKYPPDFPLGAKTFYVVPVAAIVLFAILIYRSYRTRLQPAVHKRLILIATVAILGAAINRWPYAFMHHGHWIPDLVDYSFLVMLALYDWASTGRVQRVTVWASALVIVVDQLKIPLAMTPLWQAFAGALQHAKL